MKKLKLSIAICFLSIISIGQTKTKKVTVNYSVNLSLSSSKQNNIKQNNASVEVGLNAISKKYNSTVFITAFRSKQSDGIKQNGVNLNFNLVNN